MSFLDDVAEKFLSPGVFPGDTLADKVVSGARITKAILDKYGLDTGAPLTDPPTETKAVISLVEKNESAYAAELSLFSSLSSAMDPAKDPVVLQMKPDELLSSILWSWRSAAAGVPVYASGYDVVLTASGDPRWNAVAMADDAARRILVFQSIVQMEQWGILSNAYQKLQMPENAPSLRGFGSAPLVAGIPAWLVVAGIAVAAIGIYFAWTAYLNSKTFDKVCAHAADTNNQALLLECVKVKKDPVQGILETMVYVLGAVGIGYLLVTYALPQLLSRRAPHAEPRALAA